MTIDWVSIVIAVVSALVAHLATKQTTSGPTSTSPLANGVTSPSQTGGTINTGHPILDAIANRRLARQLSSTGGTSSAPTVEAHPLLSGVVQTLEGILQANPSLVTQLQGVVVQLTHPGGTINLSLGKSTAAAAATIVKPT